MEINPEQIERAERYKLAIGSIIPRPIAFVSTVSPRGITNLAPYSFFSGVSSNPMTVLFCPANNPDGADKDTLRNIRHSGEFVVNIVSESFAHQMAACAEDLPYENSEFELSGLDQSASRVVACPRVAQAKVAFECRQLQIVSLNPGEAAGGNVVIGQVHWVYVDDDIIDERMRIDPEQLGTIGRLGGLSYCRTTDVFSIPRGRAALDASS